MEATSINNVSAYDPPELFLSHKRDTFHELLFCLIVPCAVAVVITLVLVSVICCCRTGLRRRLKSTPKTNLDDYESIKQAAILLHHMDSKRDTPLLSRSLAAESLQEATTTNECQKQAASAPGTLQRSEEGVAQLQIRPSCKSSTKVAGMIQQKSSQGAECHVPGSGQVKDTA